MRILGMMVAVITLSACQWVKPTEEGSQVALVKPAHVVNCERLGVAQAQSKHRVGLVKRKEEKVGKELITLAKNEAAKMGGDTIIAQGQHKDGQQAFVVYDCH